MNANDIPTVLEFEAKLERHVFSFTEFSINRFKAAIRKERFYMKVAIAGGADHLKAYHEFARRAFTSQAPRTEHHLKTAHGIPADQ